MTDTSWQGSGLWYDSIVGETGHYYHTNIILPGVIRLLHLQPNSSVLDIACGQGVLARHIPKQTPYVGIDGAKELIAKAKSYHPGQKNREFFHGDVTKPFPIATERLFSHATIILALQNIASMDPVFAHAKQHLKADGKLLIVLNHPCFRIPRQSAWGFDEASKTQFRRLNCYMSALKIPIASHPGRKSSSTTVSFHHPLSAYINGLSKAGFVVDALEEWCSDKVSTGKAKAWENRARKEFPLFMAIRATVAEAHSCP